MLTFWHLGPPPKGPPEIPSTPTCNTASIPSALLAPTFPPGTARWNALSSRQKHPLSITFRLCGSQATRSASLRIPVRHPCFFLADVLTLHCKCRDSETALETFPSVSFCPPWLDTLETRSPAPRTPCDFSPQASEATSYASLRFLRKFAKSRCGPIM